MWPDRRLCDLLGIDHPIIQAPMAGSATPELAAAVSNAGGLGSLGCASMSVDQVDASVKRLRALTNRPFNLNFFCHPAPSLNATEFERIRKRLAPYYRELSLPLPVTLPAGGPGFDEVRLELILDLRPSVVSFHFGLPDPSAIGRLKSAGIVILSTATTVAEAEFLAFSGADAIIAQGYEAGGHRGSHQPREPWDGIGLMSLLPQVADAVSQPIIAAGGIADGRGIAAAFTLGASGVQMGTAFLSCPEAGTDEARRAMLRKAKDTDTMMTDAFSGRAARAFRTRYALAMMKQREPLLEFPLLHDLTDPLAKAANESQDFVFHLYGQSAALCRETPASDLVSQLVAATAREIEKLQT
jgi:nitronate monooxygenase